MRHALIDLNGLHPELTPHVMQAPLGRGIYHPLVFVRGIDHPFFLQPIEGCTNWIEYANYCLAQKQAMIGQAVAERDWHTYIFAHERPHRFDAIRTIIAEGHASIDDLWTVIGDAWSDSENIWKFSNDWLMLWQTKSRKRHLVMDKEDLAVWRSLPDRLTIYRGVGSENDWDAEEECIWGLSWSLDRQQAVWFAHRSASGRKCPFIATASIRKRHCFAYFDGRKESEIVVNPAKLPLRFDLKKLRRKNK
jgi:hypothetical protein